MSENRSRAPWRTSIADVKDDAITVRGYDLVSELAGKISFAEMVYLLFKGSLPSPGQARMIDALFICCAEHGISPSSTVSRFIQAAGVPIQCSVAAGVMMFGDIHGGAGQEFCRNLQELIRKAEESGRDFGDVAREFVSAHKRVDGFGHPQHRNGDPRVSRLFAIAEECGVAGSGIGMTRALETAIEQKVGRRIHANIDAAVGAISADLGIGWALSRAMIVVPRTAGLFAHCHEEMMREPGWRQIPLSQVEYDGPPAGTRS